MLTSSDLLDSLVNVQDLSLSLYPLFGVEGYDGNYFSEHLNLDDFGLTEWHCENKLPRSTKIYMSNDTHSLVLVLPVDFDTHHYRLVVVNSLTFSGLHSDDVNGLINYFENYDFK